jgi:hypothetical protein
LLGENKKEFWLKQQQQRLKANRTSQVINELTKLEAIEKEKLAGLVQRASATKEDQPAAVCKRYLENRLEHLDYKTALNKGLPISSVETESGHRWLIQARLKIAGAWWKTDNGQRKLKLRTVRANGEWESYWRRVRQAAA